MAGPKLSHRQEAKALHLFFTSPLPRRSRQEWKGLIKPEKLRVKVAEVHRKIKLITV